MGTARAEIEIEKDAERVWSVVGDFGSIGSWMPGLESCAVVGDDRILKMLGIEIIERLESRDSDARVLVYAIVGGVPVANHKATIKVADSSAGSLVTWDVDVEPDEMTELLRQTYQSALEALKEYLGSD
jgi:carbon monoxide dehydrogenase subunit G